MIFNLLLALIFAADEPAADSGSADSGSADSGSVSGSSSGSSSGSGSHSGSGSPVQGSFSVVAAAVHSGDHSGSPTPVTLPPTPGTVPPQIAPATAIPGTPPVFSYIPAIQKPQKIVKASMPEVPTQMIGKAKCTQCKSWHKKWICETCVKHVSKHKAKGMKKKHTKEVVCITQNGKKICGKKAH